MKNIKEMNVDELDRLSLIVSNWLKNYTEEVTKKVIQKIDLIVADEMTMRLLNELYEREKSALKEYTNGIKNLISNYDEFNQYSLKESCLLHSSSYRDVLYDLYIK